MSHNGIIIYSKTRESKTRTMEYPWYVRPTQNKYGRVNAMQYTPPLFEEMIYRYSYTSQPELAQERLTYKAMTLSHTWIFHLV